jgi:hypothetical protein
VKYYPSAWEAFKFRELFFVFHSVSLFICILPPKFNGLLCGDSKDESKNGTEIGIL